VTAADLGLANAELTSNKGQANGYASLDANGKIPNAQLPPLAITQTFVVSSEAQMLALDAMTGDIAVRSDLNKSFILSTMDSTVLTNWQELLTPPSSVLSVNGKTGVVSLASTDLSDTANIVFPSSTHTLTNKTYNAESTGNVLTVPFKQYSQAAGCESTNPYTMLDVPASNYPSPVCLTGTNIQKGGLRFTNAGNQTAQLTFYVPSDQTGTYDYRLMTLPATTVASTWQLSYACAAAGATDDAAFTAYTAITITATGANYFTVGSQTGQTGCSAGKMMHLKIARTDTTGPATIDLLGFEVTLRRAM
jgi:hypothetical protein